MNGAPPHVSVWGEASPGSYTLSGRVCAIKLIRYERWHGTDADLDTAHLMRLAGRFSRRVRGFATAHGIPVVECGRGERKHRLAEEYLAAHPGTQGLFLILVARAVAPVWEVTRSASGVLMNLVVWT